MHQRGALRLSAHILTEDKTQLAGQLLGRLQSFNQIEIKSLLLQAKQWKTSPWLRPLKTCLTSPGGRLLRTLEGKHPVAVTPDGHLLISASDDNSLKVWDLVTGEEIFILIGHTKAINAIAITSDSKYIISASNDKTLKVFKLVKYCGVGIPSLPALVYLNRAGIAINEKFYDV